MASTTSTSHITERPKLILRTYKAADLKGVQDLFKTTYYSLVPDGVRRKLWVPVTWITWFAVYSVLIATVPPLIFGNHPDTADSWPELWLKLLLAVTWAMIAFALLFLMVDRFEVPHFIENAIANDLADPDVSYLRNDGMLTGMVGMMHNSHQIMSKKPNEGKMWQRVGKEVLNFLHLPVPHWFEPAEPFCVFAEAHPPNTANIEHLIVENSFQNCGLSNFLVSRAMHWAADHGIQRVFATVNELQKQAEDVLVNRHGFQKIKKESTGWFGQSNTYLECNVAEWLKANETK